jgi:general stress protein YciG
VKEFYRQVASEGGKARAEKYDHETLSKWAKKGGRPRKGASKSKSAPKRGKEARK